jgi:NitT/TauT family transport system substrate-binding protein
VRSDFAEKYPEIVVAYLKSALEGDRLLREDPEGLAEQYEKWTGIEAEVFYAFHGPHGIQTRDYTFKPEVLKAIAGAAETLKILKRHRTTSRSANMWMTDIFARRRKNLAPITTLV